MKTQKISDEITISKSSCICCKHRLFVGGFSEGSVYCRRYPPVADKDGYGVLVKVHYDGTCGEHKLGTAAFTKESLEIARRLASCGQPVVTKKPKKR